MTRYTTWRKDGETVKTPIPENETTNNPDPDGTNAKMLSDGWLPTHVDPIPGVQMVRRPLRTSFYF